MPLITVGIPLYNGQDRIERAVRSVLNQTFDDFELIVTDDGSADESVNVVRSFSDDRLVLVEGKHNRGISYRLNQQIGLAKGEYFVRMDADDIMFPDRLVKQLDVMRKNPRIDVLGSSVVVVDENENVVGMRGHTGGQMTKVDRLSHPTVFGKIEWFRKNRYDERFSGCEDYELWLRTCHNSNFYELSEPLLFYFENSHVDLKKAIRYRKIGNKVIFHSRKYIDGAYLRIIKNYLILFFFFVLHIMKCVSIVKPQRCDKLAQNEFEKYSKLLLDI